MEPSTPILPADPAPKPRSRRQILLFALAPIALIALLTGAVRLVSDAEQRREAISDAPPLRQSADPNRPRPLPPVLTPADKPTQAALEIVVRGQLQAIAAHDFAKALSFAVEPLRGSTNPRGFQTVIENGYAPMLNMKRIDVNDARIQTLQSGLKSAIVDITVVTHTGERAEYGYMLGRVGDGWQVQGVMSRTASRPPRFDDETGRSLPGPPVL